MIFFLKSNVKPHHRKGRPVSGYSRRGPVYVQRKVKNAADVHAWACSAGIKDVVPADKMHVTVAYSKTPVEHGDIQPAGPLKVPAGGRSVARLGSDSSVVLHLDHQDLRDRWQQLQDEHGATWDFPYTPGEYNPHVTLSYSDQGDIDPSTIPPFDGEIHLADEEVEDLAPGWRSTLTKAESSDWKQPTPAQAEAGNYYKPEVKWRGLTIKIENPAGSVREDTQHTPPRWRTKMVNDYGYVTRSEGVDGDEVDVYLGPDLETANTVYVVHQRKAGDWKAYDEDKCMLGFATEADAKAAYLKHYDDERFLGPITAMPAEEFVEKIKGTREKPAMIKCLVLFLKAHVRGHFRTLGTGGRVYVAPHDRKGGAAEGQLDMFGGGSAPAAEKHVMPKKEAIAEHKRLVAVLRSPSHADDKVEAKKQEAEMKEMQDGADHDDLLRDLPEGAKFKRGKGLIAGHYAVELNGQTLGNYHPKPEDAVSQAKQHLRWKAESDAEKKRRSDALQAARERLLAGGEATGADLKLLNLRDGSSDLRWFIPAAAEMFGITSRAVRPHIAGMIRIGHTDMGVKREFVSPKQALQAIAAKISASAPAKPAPKEAPTAEDQADSRRKYYVTMVRDPGPRQKVGYLAGPFDKHDDALAHVDRAREHAEQVDPRAAFDSFGTAGVVADKHPPGVLNGRLGIE